jgi:putative OPT family oligopeptide transporter
MSVKPFIPAETILPEITVKAVILSIILTVVLGAANAYLGMKIGITVSASIPAAIISMGVLRWFRESNVLENSIVQTAASTGEGLVAGVIFTLPALLTLHYWQTFDYWQTVLVALIGGILGIIFSVPLRRIMLADPDLRFPEGVAIASVLKVSAGTDISMKPLAYGGLIGGFISFAQSGLQIFSESVSCWFVHNERMIGLGIGFSPAIIAAGYIVGAFVGVSVIIGMVIAWLFCLPWLSFGAHMDMHNLMDSAMQIWSTKIRYIGVGTMLVGGAWTFICLCRPLIKSIRTNMKLYKKENNQTELLRTEKDIPMRYLNWLLVIMLVPLFTFLYSSLTQTDIVLSHMMHITLTTSATLITVIAGFILSAICAYFAGLVGSSSSPISGVSLSVILLASVIFWAIVHHSIDLSVPKIALHIAAYTIIVTGIITSSGVISNDTIQDLKSGQLVGSTPWKQQIMLLVGVTAAAFAIPEVLKLLFNAYGIAGIMPRPNMDPNQMLAAPQATLMAAVAKGVFGGKLQWNLIFTGMVVGALSIIADEIAKRKDLRIPVLAVGMGIYLPFDVTSALAIGGLLSWFVHRRSEKLPTKRRDHNRQNATMLACGLVAGSALMGVILAIPFVIMQSSDALRIMPAGMTWLANLLGCLSLAVLVTWIYRTAMKK